MQKDTKAFLKKWNGLSKIKGETSTIEEMYERAAATAHLITSEKIEEMYQKAVATAHFLTSKKDYQEIMENAITGIETEPFFIKCINAEVSLTKQDTKELRALYSQINDIFSNSYKLRTLKNKKSALSFLFRGDSSFRAFRNALARGVLLIKIYEICKSKNITKKALENDLKTLARYHADSVYIGQIEEIIKLLEIKASSTPLLIVKELQRVYELDDRTSRRLMEVLFKRSENSMFYKKFRLVPCLDMQKILA